MPPAAAAVALRPQAEAVASTNETSRTAPSSDETRLYPWFLSVHGDAFVAARWLIPLRRPSAIRTRPRPCSLMSAPGAG
jgi:hypothetical protein